MIVKQAIVIPLRLLIGLATLVVLPFALLLDGLRLIFSGHGEDPEIAFAVFDLAESVWIRLNGWVEK